MTRVSYYNTCHSIVYWKSSFMFHVKHLFVKYHSDICFFQKKALILQPVSEHGFNAHRSFYKGKVLEWLKRHAWKACNRLKRFGGSNPPLSAEKGRFLTFPFLRFTKSLPPVSSLSLDAPAESTAQYRFCS